MHRAEAGRVGCLLFFLVFLPPPFCEDYGHMVTAAQYNAENRKKKEKKISASQRLDRNTVTHCAQQYRQYNEHVHYYVTQ